MNRSRAIPRDFQAEGSERSQQYALALSSIASPDLLEALLHAVAALHEYGGEVNIAAARQRFDRRGRPTERGGAFETFAYKVGYTEKARGQEAEPDVRFEDAEEPEFPEVSEPDVESVEKTADELAAAAANSGG